jgi:hypothetical protein
MLVSYFAYSLTLKIEVMCFSENRLTFNEQYSSISQNRALYKYTHCQAQKQRGVQIFVFCRSIIFFASSNFIRARIYEV